MLPALCSMRTGRHEAASVEVHARGEIGARIALRCCGNFRTAARRADPSSRTDLKMPSGSNGRPGGGRIRSSDEHATQRAPWVLITLLMASDRHGEERAASGSAVRRRASNRTASSSAVRSRASSRTTTVALLELFTSAAVRKGSATPPLKQMLSPASSAFASD